MTKTELIAKLCSLELVYCSPDYHTDRDTFEPLITSKPELGIKCLYGWMSHYFVSFRSKDLIEVFSHNPTWDTFQTAAFFLMLDRVIAAVALDGKVNSQVADCIRYTLKPGFNIDEESYNWVVLYSRMNPDQKFVA